VPPLLVITGANKRYPGVHALAGVGLEVDAGEVHALLGENGAGKSTLMKIIAGSVTPDSGEMKVAGDTVGFGSPETARANGIGIVYQELSLVPSLSIGENVLLGHWPRTRFRTIDWEELHRTAKRHLDRIGFRAETRSRLGELGTAERQLVEIAKALSSEVRVLLLDEPTSALSERESRRLFAIIRDLKDSDVAVVYVSHRLTEVLEIADRITVLRDGRLIGTLSAAQVDEAELARMMVGRSLQSELRTPSPRPPLAGEVVLRVSGIARPPRLKPVDLELRKGEIVAIFGLVGAGRTRLARTLFGLEPSTEGEVELFGRPVRLSSPADAIEAGLGYLGEDRTAGVVPRMSIAENLTLASLRGISRGPLLDFGKERALAKQYVEDLNIRVPSINRLIETLSGGNQQKVVLGRWLCSRARILILDDPTRGIDVGSKEEVFRLVRQLAAEGVATLYLTSEIREASALADRIIVMAGGRIATTVDAGAPDEEIMAAAGGVHG
jgi:ribose transport system ATP-binding protein